MRTVRKGVRMTTIQQYPDGVVYVGLGFLLGVLVGVLLTTRCADDGNRAAMRPVTEAEDAGNVTPFTQQHRKVA